jgi:hypothetical protein
MKKPQRKRIIAESPGRRQSRGTARVATKYLGRAIAVAGRLPRRKDNG